MNDDEKLWLAVSVAMVVLFFCAIVAIHLVFAIRNAINLDGIADLDDGTDEHEPLSDAGSDTGEWKRPGE